MQRLRAEQAQTFAHTRTSGHLLGAIGLEAGEAVDTAPTALVSDYPAPTESMIEINRDVLQHGKRNGMLAWEAWQGQHGVAAFNAEEVESPGGGVQALDARQVMREFSTR